ncbi:MAG: hypothetical protein M4579_003688 [Chaenotheca gracillima]|nr:MAG: hypothetical protein M4579_003688 [Chaenotheca gracillima]
MAAVEDSDYAARTVRDAFGRYLAGPVALGAAVPDPPAPPAPLPSFAGRTVSSGYAAPAADGEVKRRVS